MKPLGNWVTRCWCRSPAPEWGNPPTSRDARYDRGIARALGGRSPGRCESGCGRRGPVGVPQALFGLLLRQGSHQALDLVSGVGPAPAGSLGVDGRAQVAEHGVGAALRLGLVQLGPSLQGCFLGHLSGALRDLRRLLPDPVHQTHRPLLSFRTRNQTNPGPTSRLITRSGTQILQLDSVPYRVKRRISVHGQPGGPGWPEYHLWPARDASYTCGDEG